jgi:hypothetical protein
MTATERLSWANNTDAWPCQPWQTRGRTSAHPPHRADNGVPRTRALR